MIPISIHYSKSVRDLLSHRLLLPLLVAFMIIAEMTPTAHAVTCQILSISVSAPNTVIVGQTLAIDTALAITCTPTTDNILARVDLLSQESNQTLSTISQGLGSVSGPSKTWNITISNTAQAPSATGTWRLLIQAWVFAGVEIRAQDKQTIEVQVIEPKQMTSTLSSTSQNSQYTVIPTSTPSPTQTTAIAGALIAIGIIAAALMVKRRKPRHDATEAIEHHEVPLEQPGSSISTGYPQLDTALGGGLPLGYSIIIISPPFDEKDMLLARMIESYISKGYSVFFVSRDLSRTRDLADRYKKNFYAFNPQADKIPGDKANVFKIQGVQNLNDVNISLGKAIESTTSKTANRVLVIDLLTDVLLEHKALTTRKWLDDFIAKRKAENFTVLGTLNPLIVSDQERQTIIDLFDGIIEIFEKEHAGRLKRYVVIRKMYARKYEDSAIELEKDRLY